MMSMMNIPTFTVAQANRYIKSLFDSDLGMQSIFISGEISNFSNHYKMQHYNVSQTLTCRLPASESTNMFVLMQIPGLTTGHLHQKI